MVYSEMRAGRPSVVQLMCWVPEAGAQRPAASTRTGTRRYWRILETAKDSQNEKECVLAGPSCYCRAIRSCSLNTSACVGIRRLPKRRVLVAVGVARTP